MSIHVTFPGGKRVDADLGGRVITTDQSAEHGGGGTAPEPFELFLASLATCAGVYVLGFCQAHGIRTNGIELIQHHQIDESTRRLERVELEILLPPDFPEKYRVPVERAAAGCRVKKALSSPPELLVTARIASPKNAA
jgi:putative redox protein